MTAWQPIETAPKNGVIVVYCRWEHDHWIAAKVENEAHEAGWENRCFADACEIAWVEGGEFFEPGTGHSFAERNANGLSKHLPMPTHWMPLPAAPIGGDA